MTASDALLKLLSTASVEVSSHGHQLAELKERFPAGLDVTITFLPGDNFRNNVATAAALRRAGFNPVPHVAAREIASTEALDDFLARLRSEADVRRVLLIAGDVAGAKGPFKSSHDVATTGLLQAHGIAHVSVAGHPEGHPYLDEAATFLGLCAWRDFARETNIRVDIVTQFCFESAPILSFLAALDAHAIKLPVTIGLAGPATPATLTKFALRCGIGNSMRALRGQIGRYGRLLVDSGPDDIMSGLAAAPALATSAIGGFHIFPFGGLRKSANWLRDYPAEAVQHAQPVPSDAHPNP
jgi:methylenetetrahydrofolate reductase (NADPH)